MRHINMLGLGQIARLADWLRKHEGEFKTQRPSLVSCAERATKELGYKVTQWNIGALRRDIGVSWPKHVSNGFKRVVQPTLNGIVPIPPQTARGILASIDERKLLCHMAVALRDMAAAWQIDSPSAVAGGEIGDKCLAAMRVAFSRNGTTQGTGDASENR